MAGLLWVAGEALGRGPWSVRGSSGSASGRSNRIKGQVKRSINRGVFVMTPQAHGNRGFYSGGKAQKRHLVADASKLCRTEGDSLFLLAKISWAQLPASLRKG